jgi:hypothetical protein
VTLEEALAELGIDHDAGSDGARRAYLRLLKTRKPETDPEGFMRLRAAYELVKVNLPYFEAFRARGPGVHTASVEVGAAMVEVGAAMVEVDAAMVEVDAAMVDVPAMDLEVPALKVEVPAVAPDLGDVDLMETLLARSAYEEAAEQALLILAAAATRFDRPAPQVLSCLRLILGLHASAAPKKAREVSAAFAAWLASSGQESARIRGHAAVLWALVRELDGLKKSLPDRVRAPIARAALAGDLEQAKTHLTIFRRRQRPAAEEAAELLRRKAPLIAAALADTLDPPAPAPVPRERTPSHQRAESSRKGLWFLPMLLMGVLRVCLAADRSSPPIDPYTRPLPNYTAPVVEPVPSFDPAAFLAPMREPVRAPVVTDVGVDAGPVDAGRPGKTRK